MTTEQYIIHIWVIRHGLCCDFTWAHFLNIEYLLQQTSRRLPVNRCGGSDGCDKGKGLN